MKEELHGIYWMCKQIRKFQIKGEKIDLGKQATQFLKMLVSENRESQLIIDFNCVVKLLTAIGLIKMLENVS